MKITHPTPPKRATGRGRPLAAASAIGTAAALLLSGLVAAPAMADPTGSSTGVGVNGASGVTPKLTVTPAESLTPAGDTTLQLTGEGYATRTANNTNFGGAYVLFGAITPKDAADPGSWAPSKQGISGTNYDFAPLEGIYQTMVSYPGNSTETGVPVMDADGDWSGELTIPGARFTSASGKIIDCHVQQCGVITFGAHGQVQGGVEVFTPVDFAPAIATTTTVAAQAAPTYTTDIAGQNVALSATVAPAAAAGSVEFFDGTTSLGSAPVADGAATLTTNKLVGGARSITAEFTPENPGAYAASESAAATYRIVDLTPAVGQIKVGTTAKMVSGAELKWSIANYVSFGSGPGKAVKSGDVVLEEVAADADATAKANRKFIFSEGKGSVDAAGNSRVAFTGSVQVLPGSQGSWTFTDPEVFTNAAGNGYITADFTGVANSEEGPDERKAGRVVVTTFTGASPAASGNQVSFEVTPTFEGQTAEGTWSGSFTGATFTNQVLRHIHSGVRAFFTQTGTTGSNLTKAGLPISVSYTAKAVKPLPFTDVKKTDKFYTEIDWMYQTGLSTGTKQKNGTVKYEPKANVSREAMAAFLYRLAGKPNFTVPSTSPFQDVKKTDKFYKEITWLAEQGITTGTAQKTGKPKFEPKSKISREAMAAFMYRYAGKPSYSAPTTSAFADVKPWQKFFKEVHWMKDAGITTGTKQPSGKPKFEPKGPVKRDAMAAFIYRFEN